MVDDPDRESLARVAAKSIAARRVAWIEDIIASLLANGITRGEIEVIQRPDGRTVVKVGGVERYEWKLELKGV